MFFKENNNQRQNESDFSNKDNFMESNIEKSHLIENQQIFTLIEEAMSCVNKVMLGKEEQVKLMFVALLAQGHVLLDDTPGMGKTTLARSMASVLGVDIKRVQFTSDLMPSDIVGIAMPNRDGQNLMKFQPGPIFTNILLADEINRASPRTQSALLEAMAEKQVTVDGISHTLPNPFWVIATQNPVDFSGTFPLPESQMDRFLFRMEIGYPDENSEMALFFGKGGQSQQNALPSLLNNKQVLKAQKLSSNQKVTEELIKYLYRLVSATRNNSNVITGLSPRAGLSLLHSAQAYSWLEGRDYVIPEDIQHIFIHATAHRLITSDYNFQERKKVAQEILENTSCP